MRSGVQGFMDEMTEFGFAPTVEAELVIYGVTAIDGPHAGNVVATGVSIDELVSWPQTPPHWIHLPSDITFPETNSQDSPRSGWLMHSRDLRGWGDAAPGINWASHIRAVLSQATT